jgi:hypothetical protein
MVGERSPTDLEEFGRCSCSRSRRAASCILPAEADSIFANRTHDCPDDDSEDIEGVLCSKIGTSVLSKWRCAVDVRGDGKKRASISESFED